MSNHNLHPHGSQNVPNSHVSPPRSFAREEDMSKELQIKLMKEKLDFVTKQLEEKDRQLDHYKQLVKTLKDVLSEVSGNKKMVHSHSSVSFTSQTSSNNSNGSKGKHFCNAYRAFADIPFVILTLSVSSSTNIFVDLLMIYSSTTSRL